MRHQSWRSLACAIAVLLAGCQFNAVDLPDADALVELEHRLARAWVEGDQATIRNLLADDWTTTDVTGTERTKDAVLREMFATTPRPIAAMTIDDVRVRMFGEVAIVTGRTTARGSGGGGEIQLRFTDVVVRRDGRWVFVASQGTPIVSPPSAAVSASSGRF